MPAIVAIGSDLLSHETDAVDLGAELRLRFAMATSSRLPSPSSSRVCVAN
jgi:hypothetical protein